MGESFGARMRRRREEQGIALGTIAEQTKIKRSLLDGLERDDVKYWPEGFFGRAFVRAYAQAIGLDPDVVVREFLDAHPQPVEVAAAAAGAGVPEGGLRSRVGSALVGSFERLRPRPEVAKETARPLVPPPIEEASSELDLQAVADLCTAFGRVHTIAELEDLLQKAAQLLDAAGLILWVWDAAASELKPALAHGYAGEMLAQLPPVTRDANNVTAAAFRSGETCVIDAADQKKGALAIPLLTASGCIGVLALELSQRSAQNRSLRPSATIFAAVLAQLIGGA
jgi:transcriptional regulator with XRE-family HTH domain